MMEGDLLEVTLDETVYLWRLLNASKNYSNELDVIRKKYNIPVSCANDRHDIRFLTSIRPQLEMPTRIYSEENIKKRKILSGDEKPSRKYTKQIKQEIKKEPLDLSDDNIDDDDVMDIEEADGTLPKKNKLKQRRVMKTKKVKKLPKIENKDSKDVVKVKPKRKKKPLAPTAVPESAQASTKPLMPAETPKPVKKVPKIKEKKVVTKPKSSQKPARKPKEEGSKAKENDSDSDSSVGESDAYETCGVPKCQRPSGEEEEEEFVVMASASMEFLKFWHSKGFNTCRYEEFYIFLPQISK